MKTSKFKDFFLSLARLVWVWELPLIQIDESRASLFLHYSGLNDKGSIFNRLESKWYSVKRWFDRHVWDTIRWYASRKNRYNIVYTDLEKTKYHDPDARIFRSNMSIMVEFISGMIESGEMDDPETRNKQFKDDMREIWDFHLNEKKNQITVEAYQTLWSYSNRFCTLDRHYNEVIERVSGDLSHTMMLKEEELRAKQTHIMGLITKNLHSLWD